MGNKREDSFFIVVDGIDGAGKGVAVSTVVEFLKQFAPHKLNLDTYWQRNHRHPQFEEQWSEKDGTVLDDYVDMNSFDIVQSSEPTHTDIGQTIRDVIIRHKGKYNARFTAEMYAADRLTLYTQLLIPALNAGKIWVQSRSFSTSIVYQQVQAAELGEALTKEEILAFKGNQLAIENPPNLLIIPTIKDVQKALDRAKRRDKDDKTWFESIEFQLKVKPHYENPELKAFFEELGTKVEYVDGGAEIQDYREQIRAVIKQHYRK